MSVERQLANRGREQIAKSQPRSLTAAPIGLIFLSALWIPVHFGDMTLFLLFNGAHSPTTDTLWLTLTTFGDGLVLGIIAGAFLLVNPRVTALAILLMVVSSLIMHSIKLAYPMPRPAAVIDSIHIIGPLLRQGSFPSGHATASLAAGLAVAYYSPNRLIGASVILFSALVAFSRVFVGAHFPEDVLAGMILSLALFYVLVRSIWPRWESGIPDRPVFEHRLFRFLVLLEILTALSVAFFYGPLFSSFPLVASCFGAVVAAFVLTTWRRTSVADAE